MSASKDNTNQPSDSKKTLIATFIITAVILLGAVIYFFTQNKELEEVNKQQQQEIANTILQMDSISNELDIRINKIRELGGNIDTLEILKAELQADKKRLLVDADYQRGRLSKLNKRVEGYKELLLSKDEEIKELKAMNDLLSEENTTLKVEKNQLNDSILRLEKNTQSLAAKVATASKLEISDIAITAINQRGKERNGGEYRNRHINEIKIQFDVLENEIAPIEGKDLLLRVIAPDGNVLFDVSRGSGSFTFEGRELFYTAKQEILYDRSSQKITYMYEKGSEYAIGQHKIEVYTDDYLMGSGSFIVK